MTKTESIQPEPGREREGGGGGGVKVSILCIKLKKNFLFEKQECNVRVSFNALRTFKNQFERFPLLWMEYRKANSV